MQAAKTGSIGITMSDYIYIKELANMNNMRAAWVYLSYREQQMQQQRDATAAQMQQMNAQQAQEQEALKAQMQMQMTAAVKEMELRNVTMEYYYKMLLEKVKQTGQIPAEMMQALQPAPEQGAPPMQEQGPPPM
jgi:membrane-bound ClpP family serine protease